MKKLLIGVVILFSLTFAANLYSDLKLLKLSPKDREFLMKRWRNPLGPLESESQRIQRILNANQNRLELDPRVDFKLFGP